jgi:hypothetical protein
MVSALSVTLNMPNIGLIIYYLVCVIILPVVIVNTHGPDVLSLYLPLLLPIASILKTSGNPNVYQNLLLGEQKSMVAVVSTFCVLALTLLGIFWLSISLGLKNQNLSDGILIGLVLSVVIFGSSLVLIPESIRKFDKFMKKHTDLELTNEWHRYVIGFVVLCIVVGVELSIFSLYDVKKSLREQIKF